MSTAVPTTVVESPQKVVEWNFLQAAQRLRLNSDLTARLQMPWREISMSVPIQKRSGEILTVECIRVLHSNARGPALGGMQIHLPTDEFIVGPMAFSNTLAAAVAEVPFGGAFGAFCCELSELEQDEREQLALGYAARMEPTLGVYRDVYAKSEGNAILNLMLGTADVDASFGEVCGKPQERGGLLDPRLAENAMPVLIRRIANELDVAEPLRVVICGEDHRTKAIARVLSAAKMKVIAIGNGYTRDLLLALNCDVLVYCGESCSITSTHAAAVRAHLVVEASPMAISPAAESAMKSNGVEIVPDLLARAPEFIAAHLEWAQNMEGKQYEKARLRETMRLRVERSCWRLLERAQQHSLTLREAAYEIAVEQLGRCEMLREAAA
ncbi:MAG TPA: Glu/Leu/Phe/Val dehydrogenase dimerization domain-containing protein [Candidatus Acidoferrales bacterium]|nr:Glu/Leu/Phe/Val dehydrogenase dimerization domain-containing protein [Candidatus Acidoferrales bacterium]